MNKIKLPSAYAKANFEWCQWVTFKCNFTCPYCIMSHRDRDGGATRWKPKELSGDDMLNFWNNIEHPQGKKLGIIGGEPTLHKDFSKIIRNLEGYHITTTTNCSSRFYKDDSFIENLQTHPTSKLRVNTSFHPGGTTPEKYLSIVSKMMENGIFVDQTSFVYTPESVVKYKSQIEEVDQGLRELGRGLFPDLFTGFWNDESGFQAGQTPSNIWPRSPKDVAAWQLPKTDMRDIEAFKDAAAQVEKAYVKNCKFAFNKMFVGPRGYIFTCHYKLYHGIDPISHITKFKLPTIEDATCYHYGFCLPCSYPKTKLAPNTRLTVNKLYNKQDMQPKEIQYLRGELADLAEEKGLIFNESTLFEAAMTFLYTGHRHFGEVLYLGDSNSSFVQYLRDKKYRMYIGRHNVKSLMKRKKTVDLIVLPNKLKDIGDFEVFMEDINPLMREGAMIAITTDIGTDAMPNIESIMTKLIQPLESIGYAQQGATDYSNIEASHPDAKIGKSPYPMAFLCMRKEYT